MGHAPFTAPPMQSQIRSSRRILYFCHENSAPSGGFREIYQHVRLLSASGYRAFIVHTNEAFHPTWFTEPSPAPRLNITRRDQLQDDDVLVVPETYVLEPSPHQRIIFCQNHFYAFIGLGTARSWRDVGVSAVIASSRAIEAFVRDKLGFSDVDLVPLAIDPTLFKPAGHKQFQVAVMPRKRPVEAEFIYQFVSRHVPDLEWAVIDNHTQARAAELLAESAIFLALNRFDGFGLPPLEAMSCACAVVGFHGFGGAEYASPENGLWAPEDDVIACSDRLLECIGWLRAGDPRFAAMVQHGQATAAQYSQSRQQAALFAVWDRLLSAG